MNLMWENIFRKKSGDTEIRKVLSENILFRDLSRREISFVESLVHVRKYRPGEYIFRQGEVGVGMYILTEGHVDITVDNPKARDGASTYVTKLNPGDFFGEIALVEDAGRRTANAISHDEVTVYGFFKPDLAELTDRNPVAGIKVILRLAEVLGLRLKATSRKITELKSEIQRA